MKKSEVKGPGDITPPKIQITSRELSFWGVLVYIYLSQCRVFLKKFHHICTYCSLNPKLIQLDPGCCQLDPVTLVHFTPKILPDLLSAPYKVYFCSLKLFFPYKSSCVEMLTGLTCVERGLQALSHNFLPSPHYSLFVTSIFILVQLRA